MSNDKTVIPNNAEQMKNPRLMTDAEIIKERLEIISFLEECDIDEDGEWFVIPEPSEHMDYINKCHERLKDLTEELLK